MLLSLSLINLVIPAAKSLCPLLQWQWGLPGVRQVPSCARLCSRQRLTWIFWTSSFFAAQARLWRRPTRLRTVLSPGIQLGRRQLPPRAESGQFWRLWGEKKLPLDQNTWTTSKGTETQTSRQARRSDSEQRFCHICQRVKSMDPVDYLQTLAQQFTMN